MSKKTVLMPITVPDSPYCWDGHISCDHFDNEGGHPHCELGFDIMELKHSYGCMKDPRCANLKKGD